MYLYLNLNLSSSRMDRNWTVNPQATSTVESLAVLIRNNAPEGELKL